MADIVSRKEDKMPHITFYNVKYDKVTHFTKEYTSALAKAIDCPEDWLVFYATESHVIMNGQDADEIAYVLVKWFARNDQTKKEVAQIITDYLQEHGFNEVAINFENIEKENYFENMEQF
jgi:phenylpyruvate tautomerase PptA (4-oxalocrotonate tautomerase family)